MLSEKTSPEYHETDNAEIRSEVDEKVPDHAHQVSWSPEEEKSLLYAEIPFSNAFNLIRANYIRCRKKIDWHLFPMLCLVFGMSLLDRTNISAAYIAGAGKELKLAQGYVARREGRTPLY
jgi:hypothetical protein